MNRWVVRVFDGSAVAYAGPFTDEARARARCDAVARRARRRGLNVSVSVRELQLRTVAIDELLDALDDDVVHIAHSFAGKPDRGDAGERQVGLRSSW